MKCIPIDWAKAKKKTDYILHTTVEFRRDIVRSISPVPNPSDGGRETPPTPTPPSKAHAARASILIELSPIKVTSEWSHGGANCTKKKIINVPKHNTRGGSAVLCTIIMHNGRHSGDLIKGSMSILRSTGAAMQIDKVADLHGFVQRINGKSCDPTATQKTRTASASVWPETLRAVFTLHLVGLAFYFANVLPLLVFVVVF